ncbi:hypothetical protein [Lacticaseibacillus jixiensis]|uniref:hypothetical protein n=1 Tax=Lacticaseibacillus jixiensis TaxID=3231926 RepID=UPI0036F2BA23
MVVKALETITLARVDDGTPGSKDVPMTYVQTAQPSGTIVKDSIWWVGDTMSSVTALKRWNGSSWIPETISQDVLNVVSLNAVNITGSTISGSSFVSSFSKVQQNGTTFTVHGTSTLENGALSTIAYKDSDNSLYSTTNVSPVDIGSVMYGSGTKVDEVRLRDGQLYLGSLYKDSASSSPYWDDGVITAEQLLMMQRCGLILWTGTAFLNGSQTLKPTMPVSKCLNGWLLEWQEYKNGSPAGTDVLATPIYKTMVAKFPGAGFNLPMTSYYGESFNKYCYPTNTTIKGNDKNGKSGSPAAGYVLTAIYAF